MLRPPVKRLPCDHCFCNGCLMERWNDGKKRCWTCQTKYNLNNLSRMKEIEKVIPIFDQQIEEAEEESLTNLNDEKKQSLLDLTKSYVKNKEYEKAILFLEILLKQSKDSFHLEAQVEEIKCCLRTNKVEKASKLTKEFCNNFDTIIKYINEEIEETLIQLVQELIKANENDISALLLSTLIKITIKTYKKTKRIIQLEILIQLIQSLPNQVQVESKFCSKNIIFKKKFTLLKEILKEMQETDNVRIKRKTETVSRLLFKMAVTYDEVGDHQNAVFRYGQAIAIVELHNSKTDDFLSECYNRLSKAEMKCANYNLAQEHFSYSLEIKKKMTACDADSSYTTTATMFGKDWRSCCVTKCFCVIFVLFLVGVICILVEYQSYTHKLFQTITGLSGKKQSKDFSVSQFLFETASDLLTEDLTT